ncbi:guanylate kinase [bacterium]|nr:guanylate kinase [bacterium]MDY4504726.1 guanylate kinase [Bariatricus sp.]
MSNIYYLMGKSSSGKDTIYKRIKELHPELKTVTIYTTRPIREGEKNGKDYYFVNEEKLQQLLDDGKVIELRTYDTVHGPWNYFTVDDGQFDQDTADYLMIGTLASYQKMREYFGEERIVPLYIEVEDGERLMRALTRERMQKEPKYAEMCRRFLADTEDFSEENLKAVGITERFENRELEETVRKISERIQQKTGELG